MRRGIAVIILVILLLACLIAVVLVNNYSENSGDDEKPFYFGVTFCGDTVEEAKALIDRVKNFTNLFVLLSGPLLGNTSAMYEIGDYAVANNLTFAGCGDVDWISHPQQGIDYSVTIRRVRWVESWIDTVEQRWGDKFLGLYYSDEPGGKMLDQKCSLFDSASGTNVVKAIGGDIFVYYANGTESGYYTNGDVSTSIPEVLGPRNGTLVVHFPWNDTTKKVRNVPEPTEETVNDYPVGTGLMWAFSVGKSTRVTYYANGTVTVLDTDHIFYYC